MKLPAVLVGAILVLSSAIARAEDSTAPTGTAKVQPPQAAGAHTMPSSAYPLLSTALGEEGDTTLRFTIKTDGSITDIRVAKSSGSPRLDEAAVEGAKNWRYVPAMQNGKPVSVPWVTRVNWRLTDTPEDIEAMGFAVLQAAPEDFPSGMARPDEERTTWVGLNISKAGKLINAYVARGSGYSALDTAAVKLAMSKVRPTAAEIDGKPIATFVPLAVIWPGLGTPAPK